MTESARPLVLHRFSLSGHSHRVHLLLSLLDLPHALIDVDLAGGAHRAAPFLAKNPYGQVPVLEDGDVVVSDSNAILVYLASRYDAARAWYPRDPLLAAQVQRWLSLAAGELAFGPASARVARLFGREIDPGPPRALATRLFTFMEAQLGEGPFLVGASPTIADVALYTYTAHANEGGITLEGYPGVRGWLARVEALPGFVPMQRVPGEGT